MNEKSNAINKKDLFYLFLCVVLSAAGAIVIGTENRQYELYGAIILFGILLTLAILIKPNIGANILVIAVFTNISSNLTDLGYPGIIKPLVVIVFAAIMTRNFYAGQLPTFRPKTARIESFLIFFFIAVTASYAVASDKDRAITAVLDMAKDGIIIYCILFALREPSKWKQVIWIIILTTTALCLLGLYQSVTGNYEQTFFELATVKVDSLSDAATTYRHAGPVHDPNMWGQVLVAVVPLALFRLIHEPKTITKLFLIAILGVILFEMLNTYSRGAYLALAVVLVLTFFVFEKGINKAAIILGTSLLVLLVPLLSPDYLTRFQSLTSLSADNGIYQDTSFRGRTSEVLTGLQMFVAHPLLGVGAGNFRNNYQKYAQAIGLEQRTEERDAHSLYVQVIAEQGIVGGIAFFGLLSALWTAISRARRSVANLSLFRKWVPWINSIQVSIAGYLVAAIFLHNAYIRYFWIIMALALVAIQLTDEMLDQNRNYLTSEASR